MLNLLYLIPALPFSVFLVLALMGGRLPKAVAAVIGVGSVGLSAALTLAIGITFISSPPPDHVYTQNLYARLLPKNSSLRFVSESQQIFFSDRSPSRPDIQSQHDSFYSQILFDDEYNRV